MFIADTVSLLLSLNRIWIGCYKLRFFKARDPSSRGFNVNCQPSISHNLEESQQCKSYKTNAQVVKGVNVCPPSNQNDGASSDSKQPNVVTKYDSITKKPF